MFLLLLQLLSDGEVSNGNTSSPTAEQVSEGFWGQPAALEKEEQETQAGFHRKDYTSTVRKSKKDMDLQHCGRKHDNLVIQEKTKHHQELHVTNFGNTETLWPTPAP